MRLVRRSCLGLLLGLISGGIPLVTAQLSGSNVDPFDYGISYLAWGATAFLCASAIGYGLPRQRVLAALSVLSGFVAAMILEIFVDYHTGRVSHNLWPLTLAFSLMIGAPPVFFGAYVGSRLRF